MSLAEAVFMLTGAGAAMGAAGVVPPVALGALMAAGGVGAFGVEMGLEVAALGLDNPGDVAATCGAGRSFNSFWYRATMDLSVLL